MGYLQWHSLLGHARHHSRLVSFIVVSRPLASTWPRFQPEPYTNHTDATHELSCTHAVIGSPLSSFCLLQGPLMIRRFSAAVDVEQQSPSDLGTQIEAEPNQEQGAQETSRAESEPDVALLQAKPKIVKKERLPAEVAIPLFFERTKMAEQVVGVLKKAPWCEETRKALEALSITYNTQLVTQVLRVRFPCDVALGFFRWLKAQNDFKHDEFTYGVLLNSLGRGGHMAELQEKLTEMKKDHCTMTPVNLISVMHWQARVGDAPKVRRHWERLKRAGQQPSLGMYTAYLDLLIRAKLFTKIPYVYEKMLSEECLPNSRLYTLLIQHLADAGRLRAAVQILEIMQKLEVVPSRVAYEFVVEGYAKAGDVGKVQEFLMAMRERFHRPSKRLMCAVKALQEAGKLEEAETLKEEIGQEGYQEVEQGIGQEMDGCADDASAPEDGESILDSLMCEWRDVTSPNVGFDVNAFAQAISSWNLSVEAELNSADVQWHSSLVLEVLRRLRNLETSWPFFHWVRSKAGFKHDKYTCMVMIQRILKSRSPMERTASLVDELFEGMQKDGIKFVVPMFNIMIRHYVLANDIERAQEMHYRIKEFGLEPNAASYGPVVQALARDRQGNNAIKMLHEMLEAGFFPDSATSAELITCLELSERLTQAHEFFKKISESGRSLTGREYKAMMAAFSRAGDQQMALTLYEQMRGAGIKPTQGMFDEVSIILRKANRQYDINTIAKVRSNLKFFGGRKKALQEDLLLVLDLFMRSMKPRANNAYASLRKAATLEESHEETPSGMDEAESVEADAPDAKAAAG